MVALENPVENPCFGCGPRHARGLRIKFERGTRPDGRSELRTTFTPATDEIGWPGLFHTGLHFLVLYEVSYWAALTLGGRLMVSTGPGAYEHQRLPRVGRPHVARAVLGAATTGGQAVHATSETIEGKPCGQLDSLWRPVSRSEVERAGLQLPDYLREEIAPE